MRGAGDRGGDRRQRADFGAADQAVGDDGLDMDLDGLMFEIEAYNRMVPTEDRREGVSAFNEKRKPAFKWQITSPAGA